MQSLLLHATSTAQWHALLHEAQQSCAIHLKEDLEYYLVFLLMRFTVKPEIASSVLGLEFLNSYQQIISYPQHQQLKEVGDKCLLYAGLFPGRATRRRVKVSYYVKLGQSAYALVSDQLAEQHALFADLCLHFPKLMDVLQAMRETSHSTMTLLQSFELWHETGSQMAWKKLCHATNALPALPVGKKNH